MRAGATSDLGVLQILHTGKMTAVVRRSDSEDLGSIWAWLKHSDGWGTEPDIDGSTLRAAAIKLGHVSGEDFDRWVDPALMIGPSDGTGD